MARQHSILSLSAVILLSLVLTTYLALANPLTQKPFNLPKEEVASKQDYRPTKDWSRFPSMDVALKALNEASSQVIETFETVMSELGDVSKYLTWSLPQKEVKARPHDWEFTVSTSALPEHSLRVKRPDGLGVDDVKQYSGYLDISDSKHFFYWFFESRNDPKNDPIVLWLNGGPGCSSLTGLFMELGPSTVDKAGTKPIHNPYSWNNNASVLFLDQPINVGYSYGDDSVSDTVAASKDVYALLVLFFKQFPEYKDLDFHIAGESYAGHYIPVFASDILSHQAKESSLTVNVAESELMELAHINLKSVLIGNGLTDGKTQYSQYANMACNNSYGPVLSDSECAAMDSAYPRCAQLIQSCYDNQNVWSCVPASLYCNNAMIGPYQRTGQNVYDVREKCADGISGKPTPAPIHLQCSYPILGSIQTYLNRKDVMDAVGAEVSSYESCNTNINRNFLFAGDWFKPYHLEVPKILERGVPVLIYAGDADYICNWMGNQAWTEALEWPGAKSFNAAEQKNFKVKSKSGGVYKTAEGFTFMRVFRAGHMVPYDQPENSLAMFNAWLSGSIQAV